MAVTGKSKNKGAEVRQGWCILGTTKMLMSLECCDRQKGRDEAVTSQASKPWHTVWLLLRAMGSHWFFLCSVFNLCFKARE